MLAAWGFLEYIFVGLLIGLVMLASLFGAWMLTTFFRNSGFNRGRH